NCALQLINTLEDPTPRLLVSEFQDLLGNPVIFLGRNVQRITGGQGITYSRTADVVEIPLALWRVGIQGLDNLLLALAKVRLAGLLLLKGNQLFIVGGNPKALNARIVQSSPVHGGANLIVV